MYTEEWLCDAKLWFIIIFIILKEPQMREFDETRDYLFIMIMIIIMTRMRHQHKQRVEWVHSFVLDETKSLLNTITECVEEK